MKNRVILNANDDIPLYFEDFKKMWDTSVDNLKLDDEILFELYLSILKIKNWKISLNHIKVIEQNVLLEEIFEDVNSSFFLSFFGLYRSAHMHLRSLIELSLQLLYFVHHPIEYKLWLKGEYVIKFDKLQEYFLKNPVFDKDITELINNIFKKWKEFSKHIHAEAPIFFQCEKDIRKTSEFSNKDFGIWKSNFNRTVYFLNKLFLLFYKRELHLFPDSSRNILLEKLSAGDLESLTNN